jgi:hypothetical protein
MESIVTVKTRTTIKWQGVRIILACSLFRVFNMHLHTTFTLYKKCTEKYKAFFLMLILRYSVVLFSCTFIYLPKIKTLLLDNFTLK